MTDHLETRNRFNRIFLLCNDCKAKEAPFPLWLPWRCDAADKGERSYLQWPENLHSALALSEGRAGGGGGGGGAKREVVIYGDSVVLFPDPLILQR